ncbi:MAG: substrate-binding periplasmic protein [Coriobacteriia bacterium]
MSRLRTASVLVIASLLVTALGGCGKKAEEPTLTPKVAPPVIGSAGVLKAGVDLDYPPFAGEDEGTKVGIDIDVAAAIAERLGLKLELVDVATADIPASLEAKQIDVALGATPITDAILANVTFAGSYLSNATALYSVSASAAAEATGAASPAAIDPENLASSKVGCQKESGAYWALESEYGEGFAVPYDSLRAAFEALAAGEVNVVACDAIVGAYLARDFPTIAYSAQLSAAVPLGVAVGKDATELETAVRETLDALSAEGVLDAIRAKWVGSLPKLEGDASEDSTVTP